MMLSTIEERILRYLVIHGSSMHGIEIPFGDIELGFLIEAVKNLDHMGLVKDCSSTDCAAAFLTERGVTYFEEQERLKYGVYYDSIKELELYIEELGSLKDDDEGHARYEEILQINNDVKGLRVGIANYRDSQWVIDAFDKNPTFSSSIEIACARLTKHMRSLIEKANKPKTTPVKNVFKPTNTVTVNNTVQVTITQTLSNVIKLENDELSPEDKQTLQQMLLELEELKTNKKDKKKLSEKVKDLGKWIFEKGIPTIASVLPYIAQLIETIKG